MNQTACWRRARHFGTLLFVLAATLFCGVLWFNNAVAAWNIHTALAVGRVELPQDAGILPVFSWSIVDVSTVTTLIPFLGFLLICVALLRSKRWDNWPFFAGYDRFNIALGLLGTLWGIILIGFYPADQVTIPALMNCLHTAMFSTLAAIIWVMIFEPLILLPLLRCLVPEEAGVNEEDTLSGEISAAASALRTLTKELERSGTDAYDLRMEFAALSEELSAGRRLSLQWRNEVTTSLRTLTEVAVALQKQNQVLSEENNTLRSTNAELSSANAALNDDKTQLILEKESVVGELKQLKSQLESVRQLLR